MDSETTGISPEHGYTDCCHATVTFSGGTLCCKGCWREIGNPEEAAGWEHGPDGTLVRRPGRGSLPAAGAGTP